MEKTLKNSHFSAFSAHILDYFSVFQEIFDTSETEVIIDKGKSVKLKELLPFSWDAET